MSGSGMGARARRGWRYGNPPARGRASAAAQLPGAGLNRANMLPLGSVR